MQRAVAVIGGGMSGLSACYHLSRSPRISQVALLEASGRLGGWLRSTRREDGAIFEHGPRGVRPAGAVGRSTLDMVSELGLEGEVLPVLASHEASKNRFLYVGGQLHRMPSGVGGLVRTVPPFSRPLAVSVLKELLTRRGDQEDESIHGFVERRLGKELADIVMDCLCRGVFAGDCRKLSLRSCFPPLFRAERDWGSVVLGLIRGGERDRKPCSGLARRAQAERWTQWSLRRGMQALPEALEDRLKADRRVTIHTQALVQGLSRPAGGSGWLIKLQDGTIKADHIISAVPAKVLASVLPPADSALSEELRGIQSVTVAVVNLEYEGSVLPFTGFGHLVPSFENRALLGIVYDSVAFPQHNRRGDPSTRLTVMMGGAWFSEAFGSPEEVTDQQLLQMATQAVKGHLGVSAEPVWSYVALQKDCIPQYTLGHWKRLEKIRHYISHHSLPLSLVGASFEGVSVNDVIRSGQMAAERIVG
ncbi:protoporphyrinogen oxidase [Lepisosteus oculatus]|uniref:protoporphyrinogen oxidase n=1 Tax=Lepisosteus oculatus TaxID=7918 RepID=UPI0037209E24